MVVATFHRFVKFHQNPFITCWDALQSVSYTLSPNSTKILDDLKSTKKIRISAKIHSPCSWPCTTPRQNSSKSIHNFFGVEMDRPKMITYFFGRGNNKHMLTAIIMSIFKFHLYQPRDHKNSLQASWSSNSDAQQKSTKGFQHLHTTLTLQCNNSTVGHRISKQKQSHLQHKFKTWNTD